MPVIHLSDTVTYEAHGSRFISYVAPARGSTLLCCWRLEVPENLQGVSHRPNREEVLLVLDGQLELTLDGAHFELRAGDVAFVPADSELRVDGGPGGGTAWVTTTAGLEATTEDGSRITPAWAR